ncbi:MAG TPA: hypothetical protein PK406_15780, partial [Verrucomicrobiota bacterium]|nr:hypothetical protein [Verrucomicrobiota bacterium]
LAGIAAEVGATPPGQATGKELRGLIRRRLNGEGCQPVEGWLPRYFEFPTRGYTERPVAEARAAYDRLATGRGGVASGGEDERDGEAASEIAGEVETGFAVEDDTLVADFEAAA